MMKAVHPLFTECASERVELFYPIGDVFLFLCEFIRVFVCDLMRPILLPLGVDATDWLLR